MASSIDRKYIKCTIEQGAFSDERIIEIEIYQEGIKSFVVSSFHCIIDLVEARLISKEENYSTVSIPNGELISVANDLIIDRD